MIYPLLYINLWTAEQTEFAGRMLFSLGLNFSQPYAVRVSPFPSPRPSPRGEGGPFGSQKQSSLPGFSTAPTRCSLSWGERAGVRGILVFGGLTDSNATQSSSEHPAKFSLAPIADAQVNAYGVFPTQHQREQRSEERGNHEQMDPKRERIKAYFVALDQIKPVASAIAQLDRAILRQRGSCLVPHLCIRNVHDFVTSFTKTVAKFGIFGIEDEVFFKESDFAEHFRAQKETTAGDKVAFPHAAVARRVFSFPAKMITVAMKRMNSASGVPENIWAVEKIDLRA